MSSDILPSIWASQASRDGARASSSGAAAVPHHGFCAEGRGGSWNVWAPWASQVDLVLEGADGGGEAERHHVAMQGESRGWFQHRSLDVSEGQRYWFRLDGATEYPDPASRWQPGGVHRASSVFLSKSFAWSDESWRGVPLRDLVIYEVHVGTFTPEGTLDAMLPRLGVLKEFGITCLELMPLAQFPGRRGWGYDGVFPFAVQQSYGGPRALQRLVDACHANGLAVLMDVVYNHLGPEGNYLANFGPYFSSKHRTWWGPAWNFDDAGSDAIRAFVLDNVRYWLEEFHLDGLRLDAIHAIVDTSAVHLLREIQQVADDVAAQSRRDIHLIAESSLNDVRILRSPAQGGYGLAAQWNDDFHHCVHTLLTGERVGYYLDFGEPAQLVKCLNETFVYDGVYSAHRDRRHGAPVGGLSGERFVISIQNHDQVGNRACGERLGSLIQPAQLRLASGLMLLSPHLPLLFMGEEYGEVRPFPYFCEFNDPGLCEAVRRGRREEFAGFAWPECLPDPFAEETFQSAVLDWNWDADRHQSGLRRWYQDLLRARREWPPLRDFGRRRATWHPLGAAAEPARQSGVLELVRSSPGHEAMSELLAIFNLSSHAQCLARPPDQEVPWHLALSSDWPTYAGQRSDRTWEAEGRLRFDWLIRPWEVLVFVAAAGSDTWKLH